MAINKEPMVRLSKNRNGFTLIELIVVLTVIVIMSSVGLPLLLDVIENQKLRGAARDLYSAFQEARFEAVNRNNPVVIAFLPAAFTPEGGAGSYQVFVDNGAGGGTAGNFIRDGNEQILSTVTMPETVSLVSASFSFGTLSTGFTAKGLPINNRSGMIQLRNNAHWYNVVQSSAGRVRTEISKDGS